MGNERPNRKRELSEHGHGGRRFGTERTLVSKPDWEGNVPGEAGQARIATFGCAGVQANGEWELVEGVRGTTGNVRDR
jgi:hypothetical protein